MAEALPRLVMADDHRIFRHGLRAQLETAEPGFEIVGEVGTADGAVEMVLSHKPDVATIDLRMPKCDGAAQTYCGVQAIRNILQYWPEANIAVITDYSELEWVREALQAGARSYLLKKDSSTFAAEIRLTAQGKSVFDAHIAGLLPALLTRNHDDVRPFGLTPAEHSTLVLGVQGKSPNEMARQLGVSLKTVRNRVSAILPKLQVSKWQDAVTIARDAGVGRDPRGPDSPDQAG